LVIDNGGPSRTPAGDLDPRRRLPAFVLVSVDPTIDSVDGLAIETTLDQVVRGLLPLDPCFEDLIEDG